MSTGRITGIVSAILTVAVLAAAWIFFAPTQVGGGTSYAVIVGNSMEPKLHRGDLAVVRRQTVYRAGDVVLYDSKDLGSKVLHRIVRVESGRFVLEGDNNDFLDAEHPTADQIVGSLWVTLPAVGRVTRWLREPLHSAFLVGLVTLIALGGGLGAGAVARRGAEPERARPRAAPLLRAPWMQSRDITTLLTGLAVAAVACIGLAVVSLGRPLSTTASVEGAYAHQGRFEYDARVPKSPVYPDGHVSTGEPVFQRLVPRLRVVFSYRLDSELPVSARGRIALDARISDGRGWERTLPLAAERPFAQGGSTVSGVLDLEQLQRIADQVRDLTGSTQTAYTVAVLPRVQVEGHVGGDSVDGVFAPALSFDAVDLRLQPNLQGGEGVGPFAPREPGNGTRTVPAELSVGPLSPSISTARRVSLVGIAMLMMLAGLALAARRRGEEADEHETFRSRYGHLLVPVAGRSGEWTQLIELADMDALVRVAEHHGKLILHVEDDHSYVVEDGSAAYRYRTHAPEPVAAMVWHQAARDLRARRDEAR